MPESFENIKMLPNWMMTDYQSMSQKSNTKAKEDSPVKTREGPWIKIEKLISEEDKETINNNQNNSMEKVERIKREHQQMRISTVKNSRKNLIGKDSKFDLFKAINTIIIFVKSKINCNYFIALKLGKKNYL